MVQQCHTGNGARDERMRTLYHGAAVLQKDNDALLRLLAQHGLPVTSGRVPVEGGRLVAGTSTKGDIRDFVKAAPA